MTINPVVSNYKDTAMRLDLVKILGVTNSVINVTVNGEPYLNFLYNIPDQVFVKYVFSISNHFFLIKIDTTCS